jgi:hypothetical protein
MKEEFIHEVKGWDYSKKSQTAIFSLYNKATDPIKIKDISLGQYIQMLTEPAHKDIFLKLRSLPVSEYKSQKKEVLKAITGSCLMDDKGRSKSNITALNGLCVVDFDELPDSFNDWNHFKSSLSKDPFCYLLHYSASGKGLCMFVKIPTKNNFVEIYLSFEKYFGEVYGAKIDYLADQNRLRFVSFDEEPFFNQKSSIYSDTEKVKITEIKPFVIKDYNRNGETPAEAFNNSGEQGLNLINNELHQRGYIITNGHGKTIYHYQRSKDASPKSIVSFYNSSVVKFSVHSTNTGLKKGKYNLFEIYKDLLNLNDYEASKKLNELGFGFFYEKKEKEIQNVTTKTNQSQEDNLSEHEKLREKYKIDLRKELPPPPVVWSMINKNGDGEAILGTLGDFGLIIGKAKSRKSFFINIAVSTALSNDVLLGRFKSYLPSGKNEVAYFDTEQSEFYVQRAVKGICRQINEEEPRNLSVFHLRSLNPAERLKFIENEIYLNDKLSFVVIDGIKDLVTSINDESEATMIASKLLKWTEERNIYVLTVLHQNKSDMNARGHIGTELINKAQTVLSITKAENDENISIVEPQQCRDKEPEVFAFEINEFGIPVEAEDFEIRTETKKNPFDVTDMENFKKYQLLTEVFSHNKLYYYKELESQLKIASKNQFGKSFGNNAISRFIPFCKNQGWLLQEKLKGPYTLGEYKQDPNDAF